MRYFPLTTDRFEHQFGIRALSDTESIVEATDHYAAELAIKRRLIQEHRDYYFRATPESLAAQRDVVDLVIASADWLSGNVNQTTGDAIEISDDAPLLSISQHVQEDLTIIRGDGVYPLIAGSVTFPSGWCIGDKLGQSILAVHEPVPEFDSVLYPPTDRLMQRLKVGRPVWRTNWGVRVSNQLDQSPIHRVELDQQRQTINAMNAGQRCFFRVERQTLQRLHPSGDILFAIHTHQAAIGDLLPREQSNLRGVLQTCPDDTLRYKGILPIRSAVVEYLAIIT